MRAARGLVLAAFMMVTALPSGGFAAPAINWGDAATADLQAAHEIIADNHPGPVNASDPDFDQWLNGGFAALLPQARAARTQFDYTQVLRDYINGFGDGHVNIAFAASETFSWPGFLTDATVIGGAVRVAVASRLSPARVGDVIESCGGIPVAMLIQDRVLRPRLNRHAPQRLVLRSPWMMVATPGDPALQWTTCQSSRGTIKLHWVPIAAPALQDEIETASGIEIPAIQFRQIGDTWLISLPTFDLSGAQVGTMHGLLAGLQKLAPQLHRARRVVIDLRGNDGGADGWGYSVAEALWGADQVDAVSNAANVDIDWRASTRNMATLQSDAKALAAQGDSQDAAALDSLAGGMQKALSAHRVFLRETGTDTGALPQTKNPFSHPVYVLTTPYCASSCLDFVDLMNALPGTIRVGLQTSSDTDYLEVSSAPLPSGLATLHYAMKVFRNRPRGANVAYDPVIPWPGGVMTDVSVTRWIAALP